MSEKNNQSEGSESTDNSQETGSTTDQVSEGSSGFSQEDLARIAAKEKNEGKRSGQREVLEALGFSSLEEARKFREAMEAAEVSKLNETQRAKKEADDYRQKYQDLQSELKTTRINSYLRTALIQNGVSDSDDVKMLSRLVEVDYDEDDEESITEKVKDLKARKPNFFTESDGTGTNPPERRLPASDPGKAPRKSPTDSSQRARDRLVSRHGSKLNRS